MKDLKVNYPPTPKVMDGFYAPFIKTHPRKATIVQHVIDEFETAITKTEEK